MVVAWQVEFSFDTSISREEAGRLIKEQGSGGPAAGSRGQGGGERDEWRQHDAGNFQRMEMDDGGDSGGAGGAGNDLFTVQLMSGDPSEVSGPVMCDRPTLASLSTQEVFMVKHGKSGMRPRYFKTVSLCPRGARFSANVHHRHNLLLPARFCRWCPIYQSCSARGATTSFTRRTSSSRRCRKKSALFASCLSMRTSANSCSTSESESQPSGDSPRLERSCRRWRGHLRRRTAAQRGVGGVQPLWRGGRRDCLSRACMCANQQRNNK